MMLSRWSKKGGTLIEVVIILVGLFLIGKAGVTATSNYRFLHSTPITNGTITGMSHLGFTLDVQVTTQQVSYVFAQNVLPVGYSMGDQVPVLYDPANPYRAMMSNFSAIWFDSVALGLAGLLIAAFGFHLRAKSSI